LIRIISGSRAGAELVVVRRALRGLRRLEEILGEEVEWTDPDGVAEQLLVSLLNQQQRYEWDALRTFWVDTEFGKVRLGRLYDITFRPTRSEEPFRLCVVPDDHHSLPVADIWTNLLLVLRGDPERFFRVANWQRGPGKWHAGPVPLDERDWLSLRCRH
jgi:hypothetical protein